MAVRRLSETGVAKIKPDPASRIDISDSVCPGLSLRVMPTGVKSWCFVYRFGGKQRRMTLGRYPDIDLVSARRIAREWREQLALGNDPFTMREEKIFEQLEKEEHGITVENIYHEFLEKHAKKNRRWKETEQVFTAYILPAMGNKVASTVTRKDVIDLLDERKKSKGPSSANRTLVALRKMYNWAIERGELEANPCSHIKKPVPIQERERVLRKQEIQKFWSACSNVGYPYGPLCQLLLLTAQRRSEIASLKWSYIDLEEKIIHIPAANVKAKRGQDVPLSDMAVSILQSLPRFKGPYVFTTCHGKKPVDGFGKVKKRFDKLASIPDMRLHDLRRTAATNMAELGIPLHTISRVLNHAEGGVTKIYARHSYLPEKRDALNKWEQRLQDIIFETSAGNVIQIPKDDEAELDEHRNPNTRKIFSGRS